MLLVISDVYYSIVLLAPPPHRFLLMLLASCSIWRQHRNNQLQETVTEGVQSKTRQRHLHNWEWGICEPFSEEFTTIHDLWYLQWHWKLFLAYKGRRL